MGSVVTTLSANDQASLNRGDSIRKRTQLGARISQLEGDGLQQYSQTVLFSDLDVASLTSAVSLTSFPANSMIVGASITLNALFVGAAISVLGVEVGDTGDPNELAATTDMLAAAGVKANATAAATTPRVETAYAPEALFTATGANLEVLTEGSVTLKIYFREIS